MSNKSYQNVCRLCLGHDDLQLLCSINDPTLTMKIKESTSLEVRENDSLPRNICNNCLGIVEFICRFRKQCLKADEILRSSTCGLDEFTLRNLLEYSVDIKEEHIKAELEDCILIPHNSVSNYSGVDDEFDVSENDDIVDTVKFTPSLNKENNDRNRQYKKRKRRYVKRKLNVNKDTRKKENSNEEVKIQKNLNEEIKIEETLNIEIKTEENLNKKIKRRKECKETEGKKRKRAKTKEKTSNKTTSGLTKLKKPKVARFQCDCCGKTFRAKYHLMVHRRLHTGEKPYACEFCPKVFRLQHAQQTHSRTHTKERPYACKVCGLRFVDQSNRNQHQNIHTNNKKFLCTLCDKRFTRKFDLNKHILRHTGGKVYECTHCTKSYADASSLTKHKKIQHKTKID